MDSNRFDTFARNLTTGDTRRGAVKTLAATGLALGLARLGLGNATAKKKKKKALGQICKKSNQCKGDLVCQITDDHNNCGYVPAAKRCCKKLGDTCNDSCECCGTSVICNGHICESA